MIKDVTLIPFKKFNPLPTYAKNVRVYTLIAIIPGGYEITLAKLSVGDSMSDKNPLSHALFESYTDHGKKMYEARTRVSGYEREFVAVKNAMFEAGVEFKPITPCHNEDLLRALGAYYKAGNPDIQDYVVVSQMRY